jgi:hypothetical protein
MCSVYDMPKEKFKTNIGVVPEVLPLYKRLATRYGAKEVVSAGAILLAQLSADQRERMVDLMNGNDPMPIDLIQRLDQAVSEAVGEAKQVRPRQKQDH